MIQLKIYFILLLFLNIELLAQNPKIDSLLSVIETSKEDISKVNVLNEISSFYLYYLPPKATSYTNEALKLSHTLNYQNGVAKSYTNLGIALFRKDEYSKAIDYYEKALSIFKKTKNKFEISICYHYLSRAYNGVGNFELAMKYCIKSLKICEKNNYKLGEGRAYENLGTINIYIGNYSLALTNLQKSLKIKLEINDVEELGRTFFGIGKVYEEINKKDSALNYYVKSLKYSRKAYHRNSESYSLNRLGNYYLTNSDYSKAKEYFKDALVINEEHENYWGEIRNLHGMGEIYIKNKEYHKALKYINRSLEVSKKINDKYGIQLSYEWLSQIYEYLNDITQAYKYHKLYTEYKDTVFNTEISTNIFKMQMGFENEKTLLIKQKDHEKQQALAEAENKKQKIITWFIGGGLLLMIVFVVFIFNRWSVAQRQKKIITEQKKHVDKAYRALDEKNNIIEGKNKDITASIRYAKRIQSAILTSDESLNNILNQHFVLFKPKDVVSGDFYWAYQTENKVIYLAADCTGHGVPGAFMSMIGNSLLNEIIIEKGITEADKILNELRKAIIKTLGQTGAAGEARDGMDIALCVWHKDTNKLEFAGANNRLYLVRKGIGNSNFLKNRNIKYFGEDLAEFKPNKQPIGYEEGKEEPFTKHEIQLQKDDTIYIFSDGYPDQFGGPKDKKFTYGKFKDVLISIHNRAMKEQKEILDKSIEDWKAGREQIDDICVIGVRIT